MNLQGFHGDNCATVGVGTIDAVGQRLMDATEVNAETTRHWTMQNLQALFPFRFIPFRSVSFRSVPQVHTPACILMGSGYSQTVLCRSTSVVFCCWSLDKEKEGAGVRRAEREDKVGGWQRGREASPAAKPKKKSY